MSNVLSTLSPVCTGLKCTAEWDWTATIYFLSRTWLGLMLTGREEKVKAPICGSEREGERETERGVASGMIAATVGCWNVHNPCLVIKDGRTPACRVTSLPQTTTELTIERFGIFLWSLEWDPLVSSDKAIAICYYARNVANVKYTRFIHRRVVE